MKNPLTRNSSTSAIIGYSLGVIAAYGLVLCFWAWVLSIILGWFGVALPLWKDILIILFLRGVALTSSTSDKDSK